MAADAGAVPAAGVAGVRAGAWAGAWAGAGDMVSLRKSCGRDRRATTTVHGWRNSRGERYSHDDEVFQHACVSLQRTTVSVLLPLGATWLLSCQLLMLPHTNFCVRNTRLFIQAPS